MVPAHDKARTVRVTVAMVALLIIIIASFVGIFTNFGYQQCSCSDLRSWFSGMVLVALGLLIPAAKGQLVK